MNYYDKMDVDQLISEAFNLLHLRDCIPTGSCDTLLEDSIFEKISNKELKHTDDKKIDKNLFKRVINAVRLLSIDSKCPEITRDDFIIFLRIAKMFVLSIVRDNIWIISKDSSMKKRNLLLENEVVNKYKSSTTLSLRTCIKNFEMIHIDGYIFDPIRVFDVFGNINHPILHGMIISVIIKHYNKIIKKTGYSYVRLNAKYMGNKNIVIDIAFQNKKK